MTLPDRIDTEKQLEDLMTTPSPRLIDAMRRVEGDLIFLGVAGKMGPTMARLARRGLEEAGRSPRILGVARFSDARLRERLENRGIETIQADLLEPGALDRIPRVPNVIYLAARKFGSTGDEPLTWAMNVHLPALVAQHFRDSRIVALSTGNVYPLTPPETGGPTEADPVGPVGEYAQSTLGRERMFQYFSHRFATRCALIRLNYAIDLRYGVLLDLARKVHAGVPIPLAMGHVNVIWQGDANEYILRALLHCASPPFVLNVTGPGVLSVRDLAAQIGARIGREPVFEGTEQPTALLNNARRCHDLLGPPSVPLEKLLDWVAHWVTISGPMLDKPTHFEARDGKF